MSRREILAELKEWAMPRPLVAIIAEYAEVLYKQLFEYMLRTRGGCYLGHNNVGGELITLRRDPTTRGIMMRVGNMSGVYFENLHHFCTCLLDGPLMEDEPRVAENVTKYLDILRPALLAEIDQ